MKVGVASVRVASILSAALILAGAGMMVVSKPASTKSAVTMRFRMTGILLMLLRRSRPDASLRCQRSGHEYFLHA
jgi:hypothetical protein